MKADGSSNLFEWQCKIPAKPSSIWAPGLFSATMTFASDYPNQPPKVRFHLIDGKPLFHPNVYVDGGVCMSIINPEGSSHAYGKGGTWKPTMNIKQVLLALQMFLDEATSLCARSRRTARVA
jgi:ubiquitin-protein ligase